MRDIALKVIEIAQAATCAAPHALGLQKIDQDGDLLEEISEIFSRPPKNVEKVYSSND